jgi:uncharacterized protein
MPILRPDLYYSSVNAIDLDALRGRGIRGALLDLDNTILPRDTGVVPPDATRFAAELASRDIKVCLVSNNWHGRVSGVAAELGFSLEIGRAHV